MAYVDPPQPVTAAGVAGLHTGNGTAASPATIYGGTGAPAASLGSNGDLYHRSDAPGTSLQRIYVKSAGSWTGIV